MRAFLRNQKSHAAKLGCDYCYAEARHENRPIWDLRTLNCEERSIERLHRDYRNAEENRVPLASVGLKGRSEVLDYLPDFDVVENIPVDPLHLLYLGVARSLFELIFNVGDNRQTNLIRRRGREKVEDGLDKVLPTILTPRELTRRPRCMDFKNYKGQEWRNLVLFYLPLVLDVMQPGLTRKIWLGYCYLARAYSLPEYAFRRLNKRFLKSIATQWYHDYYRAFGGTNMRYNIHLLWHLERIIVHGPFSEISAFPFEGSFSASNRAQKVGTSSIGLQSMTQSFLRPSNGHRCK